MKKPYRQADGFYHVDGKKYKTLFGSREQVMNGTVYKTTGGLTKDDLVMNKWGRIVSANKYKTAKKEMRLQKHGFFAKKGKFGAVTRKVRGGKKGGADPLEIEKSESASSPVSASATGETSSPSDITPQPLVNLNLSQGTTDITPPQTPISQDLSQIQSQKPNEQSGGEGTPEKRLKKTRSPKRDEDGEVIYRDHRKSGKKKSSSEKKIESPK